MPSLKNVPLRKKAPSSGLFLSLKEQACRLTSENWGGVCGFTGDATLLLTGDVPSAASTAFCFVAESLFIRVGQKAWGYSAAAAAFCAAYVSLLTSSVINSGPLIRDAMIAQAAFWAVGALRAPLASIGERFGKPFLRKIADGIQKPVGIGTSLGAATLFVSSTTHAVAAGTPHAWVLPAASGLWTANNVLSGRVQELFFPARKEAAAGIQEAVQTGNVPVRSLSLPVPEKSQDHAHK